MEQLLKARQEVTGEKKSDERGVTETNSIRTQQYRRPLTKLQYFLPFKATWKPNFITQLQPYAQNKPTDQKPPHGHPPEALRGPAASALATGTRAFPSAPRVTVRQPPGTAPLRSTARPDVSSRIRFSLLCSKLQEQAIRFAYSPISRPARKMETAAERGGAGAAGGGGGEGAGTGVAGRGPAAGAAPSRA